MNDNYNGSGANTARQPPPNRDMSYHEDYQNGNNYYGHPNRNMNGNGNGNDNDMNGEKSNRQRKRSSGSRSISRSRSRSRSVSSRRNNRKGHHARSRSRSRSASRSPRSKGRERRDRRRSRSRSTSRSRYRHRRGRNRRSESRSRSPGSRKGGRRRSGGRSMSPSRDFSRSRSRDRSTSRRSRSPRRGRNQNSPHRRSPSRERSRSLGRGGNFGGQPPYAMDDDNYRRGPPMMHRGDPQHYGYPERSPYGPGVNHYGGGGGGYGNFGHPPQSHGPGGNGPGPAGSGGGGGGGGGGARDRRRGRRGGQEGVSLLVRNLSADITTHDLEYAFRRIGAVRDVYIPTDYHSRQPKGFAFVEYATQEQATEAKNEMNRFVIKGRPLEVLFAQEKRKTPGEMKGRSDGDEGGNHGRVRSSSFERHMERERRGRPPR